MQQAAACGMPQSPCLLTRLLCDASMRHVCPCSWKASPLVRRPPKPVPFCGGGFVGNKTCANPVHCCSGAGWCWNDFDHCRYELLCCAGTCRAGAMLTRTPARLTNPASCRSAVSTDNRNQPPPGKLAVGSASQPCKTSASRSAGLKTVLEGRARASLTTAPAVAAAWATSCAAMRRSAALWRGGAGTTPTIAGKPRLWEEELADPGANALRVQHTYCSLQVQRQFGPRLPCFL